MHMPNKPDPVPPTWEDVIEEYIRHVKSVSLVLISHANFSQLKTTPSLVAYTSSPYSEDTEEAVVCTAWLKSQLSFET